MTIDRHFQRIANRLRVFDLVGEGQQETDDGYSPGRPGGAASRRFLGFYSREGIRQAFEAYGVAERLREQGLRDWRVIISADEANRHRLQVVLGDVVDDDHRVMDFVVRPISVRSATLTEGRRMRGTFSTVHVEWLCLQNPMERFGRERPRLPGQRFPGLGLGYAAHNMTLLMAQRLGHHGVINVPEHFHLAVIYDRAGYDFVSRRHERDVDVALRGTRGLHFACAAWAAERGLIRYLDGESAGQRWEYRPAEMLAPVEESFAEVVGSLKERLRRYRQSQRAPRVGVDRDELRQSFLDDPVEGIDPDLVR